jgi:hypothetical protein
MMRQNFYSKANNYSLHVKWLAMGARKKELICQVALINAAQYLVNRTDDRLLNNLY